MHPADLRDLNHGEMRKTRRTRKKARCSCKGGRFVNRPYVSRFAHEVTEGDNTISKSIFPIIARIRLSVSI